MCHAKNEKRKKQLTEEIKLPNKKSERLKKGNLQILENIGSGHHQKCGNERKN